MLEKSFRNKSQRHSFLLLTWQGWISQTEHVSLWPTFYIKNPLLQTFFTVWPVVMMTMMVMMMICKESSPGLVVVVSPVLFLLELQRVKIWFIVAGKFASFEKYSDCLTILQFVWQLFVFSTLFVCFFWKYYFFVNFKDLLKHFFVFW